MRTTTSTRRTFLRSSAIAAVGAATLAGPGVASAQADFGGYLDDVGNYDGSVADETDADEVTIRVGADGNGGPFAFDPPAVRVTPGTTIVWEWVAELHNVVDEDGAFESEMTGEAGHTFEHTVDAPGVIQYYCGPHKAMGMKGVVDVVEDAGGASEAGEESAGTGEEGAGAGDGGSEGREGSGDGATHRSDPVIPSVIALAFVVPAAYAALTGRDGDDGE